MCVSSNGGTSGIILIASIYERDKMTKEDLEILKQFLSAFLVFDVPTQEEVIKILKILHGDS